MLKFNLLGIGPQSHVKVQVDPTHQAVRASLRPLEHVVDGIIGGHYYLGATTGAINNAPAGDQLFAVRWNDGNNVFVLTHLAVSACCTAFNNSDGINVELLRASSYTVNATGGTHIIPSTTSQMAHQSKMSSSSLTSSGEIRVASGVAGFTPGTQILDTEGLAAVECGGLAGVATPLQSLFNTFNPAAYPLVFSNNQGFVVRVVTTVTGNNAFRFSIQMSWIEVSTF